MKAPKLVLVLMAVFMSLVAFSQTDSTKTDTSSTSTQTDSTAQDSIKTNLESGGSASTLPQSQTVQNQPTVPAANFGRYYIPVLGSYKPSASEGETETTTESNVASSTITITGDESNAGKVWVEGLTPVKFYALLKAVPGTYKIPAQKQDDKNIPEGTITYDESTKNITICVGCGYKNPSDVSATTDESTAKGKFKKSKAVITFTGTKTDQGTAQTK